MVTIETLERRVRARQQLPAPSERRHLRVASGSSLSEFAEALDVTRECVRLWERGERMPRGENLEAYHHLLTTLRGALTP